MKEKALKHLEGLDAGKRFKVQLASDCGFVGFPAGEIFIRERPGAVNIG